eukprot:TRINITY_DN19616_c0_g1_i5.p1 TRINITY_DN19616_c0_g1~~TRINITY_DN19616_c0_g1_i5.p1  ORF type:complete len:174 (-),score=12.02 TRINITY_DN19616_c0_g1_i5:476-997(-)
MDGNATVVYAPLPGIDRADVAYIHFCTAVVLLMTPGLAFFYGGLVRAKNVINTMFMSIVCMGVIALVWALVGFTMAFGGGEYLLDSRYLAFRGLGDKLWPETSIPAIQFATFQTTFPVIAAAVISGSTFVPNLSLRGSYEEPSEDCRCSGDSVCQIGGKVSTYNGPLESKREA